MKVKDRLTIFIKKSKGLSGKSYALLGAFMLAVIIILGAFSAKQGNAVVADIQEQDIQYRITVAGDVRVSDNIRKMANKTSYRSLLAGVEDCFQNSDHVMMNISGPVLQYGVQNYKSTRDKMEESIYVRAAALRGFARAGVNVFAFANDDTYNYGITGIESTIRVLEKNQYEYLGIAQNTETDFAKILSFEGKNADGTKIERKISLLNVNDNIRKYSTVSDKKTGIVNSSISTLYETIYSLSETTDYVIAYVHFYENTNTTSLEEQESLAKNLVDAGADLVIGNSESLHYMEKYKDSLILYSLGSFLSDAMYTNEKDSVMADFVITKDNEMKVYLTPVHLEEGKPEIKLSGFYHTRICKLLTSELEEKDYRITEDGRIEVSLGMLENRAVIVE